MQRFSLSPHFFSLTNVSLQKRKTKKPQKTRDWSLDSRIDIIPTFDCTLTPKLEYAAVNKKSSRGRAVALQPPRPPTPPLWVKEDRPIIAIDYYQRQTPCWKIEGGSSSLQLRGWGAGGVGFPGQTHTCTHSGVQISPLVQGAVFDWISRPDAQMLVLKHLISWWLWQNSSGATDSLDFLPPFPSSVPSPEGGVGF